MRAFVLALLTVALLCAPASGSWTKPRTLPDSTGVGALPRAAMGLNGTVAVAFERQGVRVAVRRDGGEIAPTTLVSSERRAVSSPAVAISGRGDIVVAWVQARSARLPLAPPYRVRAISYIPKRGWGRARTIGETPYFDSARPQISANAAGDAAIAWRCAGIGPLSGQPDAVCVTSRRFGHGFDTARLVNETSGVEGVQFPQVAVGRKGSVHLVWTRVPGPVVRYAYYGASRRWTRPRTLSELPASRPRMVAAADGALVVAWHAAPLTSGGSDAVYGPLSARVRTATGRFSDIQQVSGIPVFEPEIAAAPSGEVMIAWSTPRGVEPALAEWSDVHWATRPRGTTLLSEEQTAAGLLDGTPSFAPTGRLGFLSDGDALLAVGGPGGVRVLTRAPFSPFAGADLISAGGDLPALVTRRGHAAVVFATTSRQGEPRLQISVLGR